MGKTTYSHQLARTLQIEVIEMRESVTVCSLKVGGMPDVQILLKTTDFEQLASKGLFTKEGGATITEVFKSVTLTDE